MQKSKNSYFLTIFLDTRRMSQQFQSIFRHSSCVKNTWKISWQQSTSQKWLMLQRGRIKLFWRKWRDSLYKLKFSINFSKNIQISLCLGPSRLKFRLNMKKAWWKSEKIRKAWWNLLVKFGLAQQKGKALWNFLSCLPFALKPGDSKFFQMSTQQNSLSIFSFYSFDHNNGKGLIFFPKDDFS